MVPFGQSQGALERFWQAWDEIRQEHERLADYVAARDFWVSYDTKLRDSSALLGQVRTDMEINTGWRSPDNPRAAATAFYGRVDAGIGSVQRWLDGGTATVGEAFGMLVDRLGANFGAVEEHRILLQRPDSDAGQVDGVVEDAVRLRDELSGLFTRVKSELDKLPHTEKWLGPTVVAPDGPTGGSPASAGSGGAPGGSGPVATGAPGPAAGVADVPAPAEPAASGPDVPVTQGATPDPGTDQLGTGQPAADQLGAGVPGGDQSGGPIPAVDPATGDPSATRLPTGDPELAGAPSATVTPTTPLPGSVPSIPTGVPGQASGPGTSPAVSPFPLTPAGVSPLSAGPPARRDGAQPIPTGSPARRDGAQSFPPVPGGSDVDRPPGAGVPVAEESPVQSRGGAAGAGFYPPIVPPMVPPMGGGVGGSGIRPGEAEFAGGPVRQAGGRDSWRAGLRPQLLGRAGEYDDDPHHFPPVRPLPGGEVLDEELWQVPDAAPATPPEPPRRGRSWGPG